MLSRSNFFQERENYDTYEIKSILFDFQNDTLKQCVFGADTKQSAKYVFTHYEPAPDTGVHNSFYVFLLGMLMSSFTLLAYDVSFRLRLLPA